MSRRLPSSVAGSIALHAVLAIGGLLFLRNLPPPELQTDPTAVEVEFFAPAPAPRAPDPPPVVQPTPPTPRAVEPERNDTARARVRAVDPVVPTVTEPTVPVEPTPAPAPAPAPAVATTATPQMPSATRLLTSVRGDVASAVATSGVVLTGPVRPQGNGSPNDTGTATDRARAAAMAPVNAALAESNHMVPAGTGRRSRLVSRRALEVFSPVRAIPNLGSSVMAAPLTIPRAANHTPPGGAAAAGDALDSAHPNSFGMATGLTALPQIPYHVVRADVEVDQDATGAIASTRVVRSSGVSRFDRAAESAIREAIPMVTDQASPTGRRSRWSFEVSNALPEATSIIGGGNSGWTVLNESSNGVRLRARVRMMSQSPL